MLRDATGMVITHLSDDMFDQVQRYTLVVCRLDDLEQVGSKRLEHHNHVRAHLPVNSKIVVQLNDLRSVHVQISVAINLSNSPEKQRSYRVHTGIQNVI